MKTKVLFVHDLIFTKDNHGNIFCGSGLDEIYFDRFFDSGFNQVVILSRVKCINEQQGRAFQNKNISVSSAVGENYLGLLRPTFYVKFFKDINQADIVVISTPSVIGSVVALFCNFLSKQYVVEVAGDGDAFSSKRGGWIFSSYLKVMMPFYVRRALGAAYVTKYLASKFPNKNKVLVSSNVNIESINTRPALTESLLNKRLIQIGFVGGINKRKGVDVLIKAAHKLIVEKGYKNLSFSIIGGHNDFDVESLLRENGVEKHFVLHGLQPKEVVFSLMQKFDLYVQPSLSEGLPRATIEAMSFGLPVIATSLPGFKEILDSNILCQPGDVDALASVIEKFIQSYDFYNSQSAKNLEIASTFLYKELHNKRCNFYRSFNDWQ